MVQYGYGVPSELLDYRHRTAHDSRPFELLGSWTLFADPVYGLASLDIGQAGILRGCVICTSRAGTIGVISLKEMDQYVSYNQNSSI